MLGSHTLLTMKCGIVALIKPAQDVMASKNHTTTTEMEVFHKPFPILP